MAVNSFLDPIKLEQVQQNYITTFDKVDTLETNLTTLSETIDNLDNNYLSLSGGTVTDTVKTTKSTFTDDDEFVSKQYVDDNAGGTSNYTDLTNKPSINNITLSGNKTLNDLGIISGSTGITVLYNNPTPTINPQTATLSQSYTDFDFIYITWKLLSDRYNPITLVFRPEDIPAYNANDTMPIDFNGTDGYIIYQISNNDIY